KLKTLAQSIAISFALAPLPALLGEWMAWVNAVLMAIALVLTVWSGLLYVRDAVRLAREHRARGWVAGRGMPRAGFPPQRMPRPGPGRPARPARPRSQIR